MHGSSSGRTLIPFTDVYVEVWSIDTEAMADEQLYGAGELESLLSSGSAGHGVVTGERAESNLKGDGERTAARVSGGDAEQGQGAWQCDWDGCSGEACHSGARLWPLPSTHKVRIRVTHLSRLSHVAVISAGFSVAAHTRSIRGLMPKAQVLRVPGGDYCTGRCPLAQRVFAVVEARSGV